MPNEASSYASSQIGLFLSRRCKKYASKQGFKIDFNDAKDALNQWDCTFKSVLQLRNETSVKPERLFNARDLVIYLASCSFHKYMWKLCRTWALFFSQVPLENGIRRMKQHHPPKRERNSRSCSWRNPHNLTFKNLLIIHQIGNQFPKAPLFPLVTKQSWTRNSQCLKP